MTRNVLMVYLKNLRDLEVARYKLETDWAKKKRRCDQEMGMLQREINQIQESHYKEEPYVELAGFKFSLAGLIFSLVVAAASPLLAGVLFVLDLLCAFILYPYGDVRKRDEVRKYNQEERRRLETVAPGQVQERQRMLQVKKTALAAFRREITPEYEQVRRLLQQAYSLNVIPNQYRNLASIYYIYDYMSSSQATLEETLMHEHMENGIQRILDKLDVIISQNEELILTARRIEANTRETAENTRRILDNEQRMIAALERTEQNTADAAQAAAVAAQYSEINAFFTTAQYLDSQKGR